MTLKREIKTLCRWISAICLHKKAIHRQKLAVYWGKFGIWTLLMASASSTHVINQLFIRHQCAADLTLWRRPPHNSLGYGMWFCHSRDLRWQSYPSQNKLVFAISSAQFRRRRITCDLMRAAQEKSVSNIKQQKKGARLHPNKET